MVGGSTSSCAVCGDVTLSRVVSPDGRFVAELMERNCGATTDYARRVDLDRTGMSGLFVKSETVFVVEGQVPVALSWARDARTLEINHTGGTVFRNTPAWRGLRINYSDRAVDEAPQLPIPEPATSEVGPPNSQD